MPPKGRIDEEVFQRALQTLNNNEIRVLDGSKATADIWGRICTLMNKADNVENRRACYDSWKRKRHVWNNLISDTLSDVQQSPNKPVNEDDASKNVTHPNDQCSSLNTIIHHQQFIEQLRELLKQQSKHISLIQTHDLNSKSCSGDIVAVQLLCTCGNSSNRVHGQDKNSSSNDLSNDTHQQNFDADKCMDSDSDDQQSDEIIISNNQDVQENEHELSPSDDLENNTTASMSPIHTPPRLFMSPISSPSPIISPKSVDMNSATDQISNTKLNTVTRLLDQTKDVLSLTKKHDHTSITDEQKAVLTYLQRQSDDSSFFTYDINEIQRIERSKAVVISQYHMDILKKFRIDYLQKKAKKNTANDSNDELNIEDRKRNLEWTLILDGYVGYSNDYCVFAYERHHYTSRSNIGNTNRFFMSANAYCTFDFCTCRCYANISENGRIKIDYSGEIKHKKGDTRGRPIRGSRRKELQQFTMLGATPGALYLQQLKSMSVANKEAGNRNVVGSSRSVIRKIASEANVRLRRDDDLDKSLRELKVEQTKKIFPGEVIPGYLQEISTDPLRLICFTAGGIAAYHQFASSIPLSWDATGGIIINRNKRIFYYELTMTSLTKGGSSLPVTVMVSASHGTMDIVHWMNCFIEKYKQVYGFSNPFPKPPVIHCDRSPVFLLAGIQVFNGDETMDRYMERCWRIIQRAATKRDLEITVVHACLGHFMKNVKRNASKILSKKQVSLGMWFMALLVNCNTLDEMIIIWRNVCIVLLSTNQNDQFKISLSTLSKMADQMNGDPEKTNFVLQGVSVTTKGQISNNMNVDNNDDITHDVGTNEDDPFYIESSFKSLFITIYQQCKDLLKIYDASEWKDLPANPLFSAAYLSRILKLYMPTAPIWSNLLLGNFAQRYGYSLESAVSPCSCHFGRTTGVSESQMRVLKEAILSKKIYTRIDEVISKLGETIEAVEIQFADFILIKRKKSRLLPANKQKKIEEPWNKRRKTAKPATGVYTSTKPSTNIMAVVNTRLLGRNDDVNLDVGQLPLLIRFENAGNTCWFNSIFQMLLASGNIVDTIRKFHIIDDDLVPCKVMILSRILNAFISKSINCHADGRKAIINKSFIKDQFGFLRWAGFDVETYKQYCVFDFFQIAIVPMLSFYDIDFQYVLDKSMQCSSCKKLISITQQTWDTLLVNQTTNEETIDSIMADLFGPVLDMQLCLNCFKNDLHPISMSILNCPKHLFILFDPHVTGNRKRPKLTAHVDFAKILSNNVICTRSYSRYTLQSFIVFNGTDDNGHYMTYARSKQDWYCLNDTNITLVKSSSIFEDQDEDYSVMMAHFTRPSELDVFSSALWNLFTNFSPINVSLTPHLSLNDAANYFAKHYLIENNPLNLVVVKFFNCSICKTGKIQLLVGKTFTITRMHDVWQIKTDALHVTYKMNSFMYEEIKCSSCNSSGLTNFVLYDIPRYLLLKTESAGTDCIDLIHDMDQIRIRPSDTHLPFDYHVQTVLLVLDEDDIVYLRKTTNGYSSLNKTTGQFVELRDFSIDETGLASRWTIFVYETDEEVFYPPLIDKITFDQSTLAEAMEPDIWTIDTVQDLLPTFPDILKVGPIQIQKDDMKILLDNDGNINDLIIDAHLSITATTAPFHKRVLALETHTISEIIEKKVKHIKKSWFDYDIILCPINQKRHWYLVIIDLERNLIIQYDSLPTHDIPRRQNLQHLIHMINIHHFLKNGTDIDFQNSWKLCEPSEDFDLYQNDQHSCGIYLLTQAKAYTNREQHKPIPQDEINLYRHQIAEELLRKAEPVFDDSISDVSISHFHIS
ncbi:unnamed protein product [Rotaria sp. Silwood1]|nr:unnamed protein product [Rotaria sp. Silwood1]CAF1639881.1 unnamed protein product [Rotaria sp. Silwood1]